MEIFEINDNTIQYNDITMKKARDFSFEGKEYIEFRNIKEHLFIVMEKITDNVCIQILDNKLRNRIMEIYFKKETDYIE
ncbi:MAG: hypothetical protein J6M60_05950 [Clostridia bacterium]|nr:hypothetical protein [Clostridia bacterium]